MNFNEFKEVIIAHKPLDLKVELQVLQYWHENYFKWYTKDELSKFLETLVLDKRDFSLSNIFEVILQFDGYLLHLEYKKALAIKEKFSNLNKDSYPKTNLSLPVKRAWLLLFEENK